MARTAVVGFGIAGACIAAQAPEGMELVVYDLAGPRCASRVATGLVNPLVLKRRRVVWRAEEALKVAMETYPSEFRSAEPIYEVLQTVTELNDWHALADHPALGPFLGEVGSVPDGVLGIGLGRVRGSFRLDVLAYLKWREGFHEVRREAVSELTALPDGRWLINQRDTFDTVLLCEGYQARWAEHFWGPLGFARTWGQGLLVQTHPRIDRMLHRSHFLLANPNGPQQLGASYGWGIEHGDLDPPPHNEEQSAVLLDSLRTWFSGTISVQGSWTGIRPTTNDRRPRWGWHPELPNLGLLNGLGSRGTLHAPLLARELWQLHPG